jgi:hypothetical protein
MVAELGNLLLVVPYMLFVVVGIVFVMIALRDRKDGSLPNLTARRKHPLRHVQVEINRARKAAFEKARAEQADEKGDKKDDEKPKRKRGPRDGPRRLRRI